MRTAPEALEAIRRARLEIDRIERLIGDSGMALIAPLGQPKAIDSDCGCLGVAVFNDYEIQRCDECNVFASDDDAALYVQRVLDDVPEILEALGAARRLLMSTTSGIPEDHPVIVQIDLTINALDPAAPAISTARPEES